jgi:tetratricopeptide (TPR) repeat protein
MELSLRSLLSIALPFPGDATSNELEPIGAVGNARSEISRGNLAAALRQLDSASDDSERAVSLRGRIFAQQRDFDALQQWAEEPFPESVENTADYWYAIGVLRAHQGNHREAVSSFCEVVLRDSTDHLAYLAMSESLEALGATESSREASRRAEMVERTQEIGQRMAAGGPREMKELSELSALLVELRRPLEALGWQAIQVFYAQSNQTLSEQRARQAMDEINQQRRRLLAEDAAPDRQFVICGVDPATL